MGQPVKRESTLGVVPAVKAAPDERRARPLSMGILIPCRDEAAVIERKLHNLASCHWSTGGHALRLAIVDDSSRDATAEIARRLCPELSAEARVVASRRPPGKAGAIATGLEELGDVDIVVLTDADVVLAPDAPALIHEAFRRDPALGMACGAQMFVRDLADDGTCRGQDLLPPHVVSSEYDRWTDRVRERESQQGRLFSVHGQLLAWRRALDLHPTPGIAADDLDLMLQARAKGARVVRLAGARFLEVKPPEGAAREAWEVRRARAYFQFRERIRPWPGAAAADVAQLRRYRTRPGQMTWVPWSVVAPFWKPAREFARLMPIVRKARELEKTSPSSDRWERSA